jgi:hypothetical protein
MIHETLFIEYKMIRGEQRHNRIGLAFINVQQWKQNSRRRFLIPGLNDQARRRLRCKLAMNFAKAEMFFGDYDDKPLRRYQAFGAIPGMLQHGSTTDKVDVLFRQVLGAPLTDELLQPGTVPGR